MFSFLRIFFLFFCFSITTYSQTDSILCNLKNIEDSIVILFKKQRIQETDKERFRLNDSICILFRKFLSYPQSFSIPLDSLKLAGHMYAPDKSFRIINWNLQQYNGTHTHFGFLQPAVPKTKPFFELKDKTDSIKNPEGSVLSASKWYGGLYYKILKNKVDNMTYYTLLGLQYHNLFTSRKFIDVLYFDEFGNPVFGAPVFQVSPQKVKLRMVFEYSASLTMSLKYNETRKQIEFDHLMPSEPKYYGLYQYYGPDLSFDGFVFENKRWQYISNIDLRNPKTPKKSVSKTTR